MRVIDRTVDTGTSPGKRGPRLVTPRYTSVMRWSAVLLVALAGCSDIGVTAVTKPGGDSAEPDTDHDPEADTADSAAEDTAPDSGGGQIPDETDYVDCAGAGLTEGQWWGSMPFSTEADLEDPAGQPYYATSFDLKDWSTVSNPDSGHTPSGSDKAYRVDLTLAATGPAIWVDLQSDDGLWLYVNEVFVGHWGGDWQEEGCVNDDANCATFEYADPVDVTAHLHAGPNVLAVRVSNAIDQSYMGVRPRCVQ